VADDNATVKLDEYGQIVPGKGATVKLDDYGQIIGSAQSSHPFDSPSLPPRPSSGGVGPTPSSAPSGWLAGGAGLVVALFACVALIAGIALAVRSGGSSSSIPPSGSSGSSRSISSSGSSSGSGALAVAEPTATPRVSAGAVAPSRNEVSPATSTRVVQEAPPTSTSRPGPQVIDTAISLGRSAGGRELRGTVLGYENGTPVVVVGSIQGDQTPTKALVEALISYYRQSDSRIPEGVLFYLIPSINPDGNTANSRFNGNNVDLNRNWDTSDWRSDAAVPGYPNGKAGAGGNRPFSEPETVALRDLLLSLRRSSANLRVVTLHSSVNVSGGEVYPGGDNAENAAAAYSGTARYDVEYSWAQYTTSGEAVTWCGENSIVAIDVVFPASLRPSSTVYGNTTLLQATVSGLQAIAD